MGDDALYVRGASWSFHVVEDLVEIAAVDEVPAEDRQRLDVGWRLIPIEVAQEQADVCGTGIQCVCFGRGVREGVGR